MLMGEERVTWPLSEVAETTPTRPFQLENRIQQSMSLEI